MDPLIHEVAWRKFQAKILNIIPPYHMGAKVLVVLTLAIPKRYIAACHVISVAVKDL